MADPLEGEDPAASGLVPIPSSGRVFRTEYRVRLGDVAPGGRARLDALARYLQDAAEDDASDAEFPRDIGWVLRRTALVLGRYPVFGEQLVVETFCSASGPRWAERTTTIRGAKGALVQAVAVWVAIDAATGRPARLGPRFEEIYGPSAGGRKASIRLDLPPPAEDELGAGREWPLRASDFDLWRHVNNAISWAAIEDELARVGWLPDRAEVEHNQAITAGDGTPRLLARSGAGQLHVWLAAGGRVLTSARLSRP
ncbi:MAG TPA: acyl-ACP thioesterase domain-containing protein [Acidimicrobiales bacterium]|nr:acyl-ACP thioesterase domain-containing protein [Acidimicrobiales bacterium]